MTGSVSHRTGPRNRAFAKILRHAAKRPLEYFAVFQAVKRHTKMLQFVYGRSGVFTHKLDGILVAQVIRAFNGVVHMPQPFIISDVA